MLSKEYLETARTILRAAQTMTDRHVRVSLRRLLRTMSGELRAGTLMRLRRWLGRLLANVSAGGITGSRKPCVHAPVGLFARTGVGHVTVAYVDT